MNGMAHVQERIASIEARFSPPVAPPDAQPAEESDFGQMFQGIASGMSGLGLGMQIDGVSVAGSGRPAGSPPSLSPQMRQAFEETADRYGLDVNLLLAVSWQESGFNPTAISHAGAIGLMQLMPGTAAGLGVDPTNPLENLDGGARYLRQQIDRFGSVELALAAYNAGPGAVMKHGGIPPFEETQNYVPRVMARWRSLDSGQRFIPTNSVSAVTPQSEPLAPSPSDETAPISTPPDVSPVEDVDAPVAPRAATEVTESPLPTSEVSEAEVPTGLPPESVVTSETKPVSVDQLIAEELELIHAENEVGTDAEAAPVDEGVLVEEVPDEVSSDHADPADGEVDLPSGVQPATAQAGDDQRGDAGSSNAGAQAGSSQVDGTSTVASTTPASTPGAAMPTDAPDTPTSVSRLPQEITRLVRDQSGEVRIELSPDGLGEISVRISLGADGEVSISIATDSEQTATVLARLHESLEAALRSEGIDLDTFDVNAQSEQDVEDDSATADLTSGSEETGEEVFDLSADGTEVELELEQSEEQPQEEPVDRSTDLRI